MVLSVVNVGNSRGIRLSKTIIEKYGIGDKLEIILEKDYIILKPTKLPRQDWDEAFKQMRENGDDQLLMDDVFEDDKLEEWN